MNEILLYDDIGDGTAREVLDALKQHQGTALTVRINSPGGALSDAVVIYNALRRYQGTVDVSIDGLAASSASLIAMAGARVAMAENALLMIHDPWSMVAGSADEMRRFADTLDKAKDSMIGAYTQKSGKTEAEIRALMKAETWFDAEQALAAGLIDEIVGDLAIAASFDLSKFKHPPAGVLTMGTKTGDSNSGSDQHNDAKIESIVAARVTRERERIQARNEQMQRQFGGVTKSWPELRDILDAAIADPHATMEQTSQKLLAKMAEGAAPAASPVGVEPGMMVNSTATVPSYFNGRVSYGANQHHSEFRDAARDAILLRAGIQVKSPHPATHDIARMRIVDVASTMLRQRGLRTDFGNNAQVIHAAYTTSDFPELLSGVANKALLSGYEESDTATHRVWTRQSTVADFKQQSRIAMSEAGELELVPEAAEYKFQTGNLGRSASFKLETYGRIFGISRQALVNDDLGGFTRLPQAFGASGSRKEAEITYALLTSNPLMSDGTALFSAAHGNLQEAASLSVESLGAARTAMRLQRGLRGEAVLNVVPKFLIVPAALETVAEQLLASLNDPAKQNDTTNPAWIRALTLVVDARLDTTSSTGWYLAASPAANDTVEIAHLEGPPLYTEDRNAFETDTYEFKARLDFAACVLDWRGLVFNPGV